MAECAASLDVETDTHPREYVVIIQRNAGRDAAQEAHRRDSRGCEVQHRVADVDRARHLATSDRARDMGPVVEYDRRAEGKTSEVRAAVHNGAGRPAARDEWMRVEDACVDDAHLDCGEIPVIRRGPGEVDAEVSPDLRGVDEWDGHIHRRLVEPVDRYVLHVRTRS